MIQHYSLSNKSYRNSSIGQTQFEVPENSICIKTCNRLEYFWGMGEVPESVIRHLFLLSAGLSSPIIGDSAILGQIKISYQETTSVTNISKHLHKLFQWSFCVGKRVRTETKISQGAVSYSQAVISFLINKFRSFGEKKFAFLGINQMNQTTIRFLLKYLKHPIMIGNRTYEKAQNFAKDFDGIPFPFSELQSALKHVDILISASSAPHSIVKKEHIPSENKLLIFDLAVPSDIEKSVSECYNVDVVHLEQIESFLKNSINKRNESYQLAKNIVEDEIVKFMNWQNRDKNYLSGKSQSFKVA